MTDCDKAHLRNLILDATPMAGQEHYVFEYVDAIVAEAREPLVALLRELGTHPRFGRDIFDWNMQVEGCRFCNTEETGDGKIPHTPECIVTRVRAVLADEKGDEA